MFYHIMQVSDLQPQVRETNMKAVRVTVKNKLAVEPKLKRETTGSNNTMELTQVVIGKIDNLKN